jgi:ribonuclease-3
MDEERKQQLLNLLRNPVFDINTSDDLKLLLYDQALTHSSYAKEQLDRGIPCKDNERLEFLGDCILDFLIGSELYKEIEELKSRYPHQKDEAILTDLLHELTNDNKLSKMVIAIDPLYKLIQRGRGQILNDTIKAGAFEAFVAAVYDDKGIEKTRTVVTGLFKEQLENPKTIVSWINKLQECVQKQERVAKVKEIIKYKSCREDGTPDDDTRHISEVYIKKSGKEWELWGTGHGKKEQDAEKEAAKNAFMKHCIEQR